MCGSVRESNAACTPETTYATQVAEVAEEVLPWISFIPSRSDIDLFDLDNHKTSLACQPGTFEDMNIPIGFRLTAS